jgi:hypothetical protein
LKSCEKKKKRNFSLLSVSGPAQPAAHRSPVSASPARGPLALLARGPLALLARGPSFLPPRHAWAEPSKPLAQQARTSAAPSLFPLSVADGAGPRVRVSFFLPTPAGFLSLIHHRPNPRLNLFLSFLGTAFGLYKSHAELNRNHLILLKLLWSSRVRSPGAGALAAASPSRATTLVRPWLRSCPR